MQNNKLITIVVTVYNKVAFLEKCLNSILNQTDKNFELLIIDDGSNDGSYELCRKICGNRVFVIRSEHQGIGNIRNIALANVNTEYILFIDGDDYIEPYTISWLMEIVASYSYDLLVFGINHVLNDGTIVNKIFSNNFVSRDFSEIQKEIMALWSSNAMYSSCNKLFRMSLIKECNLSFPDCDFGEDLKFVCEYFNNIKSIYVSDKCLYYYVQHTTDSLSKKIRSDFYEIRKKEYSYMNQFFYINNQLDSYESKEYLARRYIERIIGCIENEVSFFNKKTFAKKISSIRAIISDDITVECVNIAVLQSRKMKILAFPIKHQFAYLCFIFGLLMTLVRNTFPMLFQYLKKHR